MNPPRLAAGEVATLVRQLPAAPDPVELYTALSDSGRQHDSLLLESGTPGMPKGERSLVAAGCALRLSGRGRRVWVESLSPNGASLLPWLAERLASPPPRPAAGCAGVPAGASGPVSLRLEDHRLLAEYAPPPRASEQARLCAPSPLDVVRAVALAPRVVDGPATLGPLVAGVFAYDLLDVFETLPPAVSDPQGWPDFELWLVDRMVWLQHQQHQAVLVAQVFGGQHAGGVYHDAARAIADLERQVEELPRRAAAARPDGEADAEVGTAVDLDDHSFAALVRRLKAHIVAGDVFQIVPSRTFSAPCADPLAAYRELRRLNPSPYMFFVHGSAGVLFGASPETAVKVDGQPRWVEIRPLAGTRPRGRRAGGGNRDGGDIDPDLDSRLEAELRLDAKELAEHMMLVDLARNDVARVSVAGSRSVPRLLGVDRYSHVMHLVSHVRGTLRPDLDALHAYAAAINMGTLTGAPKIEAARLLRRYETSKRGPYGGAVGYLTNDGRMDTAIVIRSAAVAGGIAQVRAGAGVVFDSEPQAEADESRRKAEAVLRAIRLSQC